MAMANRTDAPRKRKRSGPSEPGALLSRPLPVNLEAEMGLLGSMVMLPTVCDEIVGKVRAEDFYDEANRILFELLLAMYNDSKKIDVALVRESLIARGVYESIGGASYLAQVFNSVPNAAHAAYYAAIVREKAVLRTLIGACTEILESAYEGQDDPQRAINAAEEKIFSINDSHSGGQLSPLETVLHQAMDRLDARMRGESLTGTVESGFIDLDRLTGGLHASELVILAARPSMGKTACAMNIAEHVAIQLHKPVLFVSLEMAAIEVVERLLCSVARVNGHRLRNGTLSADDRKRLVSRAGEISTAPLFIDDSPSRTVAEISGTARRIKRKHEDLGLLVIDYLQLIQPDNASDPRHEQVARIARRLKGLARELRIPVLCLSQLNRQAEDSRDHIPKLSHLRESGAIEQDADVVMFVHREEYFLHGEEKAAVEGEAQIIVAKQRNGPTDTVHLSWLKDFTRFENRAAERHSEFDDFGL